MGRGSRHNKNNETRKAVEKASEITVNSEENSNGAPNESGIEVEVSRDQSYREDEGKTEPELREHQETSRRGTKPRGDEHRNRRFGAGDDSDQCYERQFGLCSYKELDGDLFESPDDFALAHCVAEDFRMNIGVAAEFRKRFENTNELLKQDKRVGEMAVWNANVGGRRFIYYLVVKKSTSDMPSFESLQSAIRHLCQHCKENDVKKLAIPPIGAGRDGLDWVGIREFLLSTFENSDIEIRVYKFSKLFHARNNGDWRKTRDWASYEKGGRPPRYHRDDAVDNYYGGDNRSDYYERQSYRGRVDGGGGGGTTEGYDDYGASGDYYNVPILTRVFVNSNLKKKYNNNNNTAANGSDGPRDGRRNY